VRPFPVHQRQNTSETIKHDRSFTAVHYALAKKETRAPNVSLCSTSHRRNDRSRRVQTRNPSIITCRFTPSLTRSARGFARAIRTHESRTKSNPLRKEFFQSHLRVTTRTVVNHLRRRRGADTDRDRRAGEVRERVRGCAHRLCVTRGVHCGCHG